MRGGFAMEAETNVKLDGADRVTVAKAVMVLPLALGLWTLAFSGDVNMLPVSAVLLAVLLLLVVVAGVFGKIQRLRGKITTEQSSAKAGVAWGAVYVLLTFFVFFVVAVMIGTWLGVDHSIWSMMRSEAGIGSTVVKIVAVLLGTLSLASWAFSTWGVTLSGLQVRHVFLGPLSAVLSAVYFLGVAGQSYCAGASAVARGSELCTFALGPILGVV